ncbi:hypothetical protein PS838_03753 [Pseudomonas fluorescens]|nr:hypothetical protein PS838_03753 [Pseudomonas fluorescens]
MKNHSSIDQFVVLMETGPGAKAWARQLQARSHIETVPGTHLPDIRDPLWELACQRRRQSIHHRTQLKARG